MSDLPKYHTQFVHRYRLSSQTPTEISPFLLFSLALDNSIIRPHFALGFLPLCV
ncbi:hypothetical protein ACRALDRAFT_204787 [Sodiomyces alcalophilus JCM 7366]|uniref:uncharacterized protein n=1 Tax=Sodiomyces alcalophilus JCM 7366 TaxID=591952 RepID=UPI0039B3683A